MNSVFSQPQISPADDSPSDDPPSFKTPIHSCYDTTEQYGINDLSREHIFPVLAINIAPYILGPMPSDAFLDQFFPLDSISIPKGIPSFQVGMFRSLLPPIPYTGTTGVTGAASATNTIGVSGVT